MSNEDYTPVDPPEWALEKALKITDECIHADELPYLFAAALAAAYQQGVEDERRDAEAEWRNGQLLEQQYIEDGER